MPIVEFHSHTIYSKDSLARPEALLAACQKKGIDRLIITDHNNIRGAQYAQQLAPQCVIVGEEIMTTAGEILAAYVVEEIPKGLPPLEVIRRLREQGAFISVSHPFDIMRSGGWKIADLLQIVPLVDAIETFNARCVSPAFNRAAQAFASQHHLPGTVGSDAHTTFELGRATLRMEDFDDAASLAKALRTARPQVRLSSPWVHFSSVYARWRKKGDARLRAYSA